MPPRHTRGRFITFEGIDGCGKSTQLKLLTRYLKQQRIPFLVTREPGGTRLGEAIRKIVLSRASGGVDARAELLLLFAARAQNVAETIRPALERGRIVLCDRFTDASLAYQGYGRGLDPRFIRRLHRFACQRLKPDLTLVIDIAPRTSVARARRRNATARHDEGRFEQETRAFYERVRRGYRALAREEPRRIKFIRGEDKIERIHQQVLARVQHLLAGFLLRGTS